MRALINSSYGTAAVLLKPVGPTAQGEPYSPFLQIEPSMVFQRGLPLLLVKQSSIPAGGVWGDSGPLIPYTIGHNKNKQSGEDHTFAALLVYIYCYKIVVA